MKRFYRTYRRGQVVYVNLGNKPNGVSRGTRPCLIVSRDESNHSRAPQVTVCPLTTKLKYKLVHVLLKRQDVSGYHLQKDSEVLPEQIVTISKDDILGEVGYLYSESEAKEQVDRAMIIQLGLLDTARKMVMEELANAK